MLKQGIIQLPNQVFPTIPSQFTEDEKKRMLIIMGFDFGKGLSILQTIPELAEKAQCIAYSDKYKALINLYFPIIKSAMNDEYVHARVISALNNATADEKEPNYQMTFLFICDEKNHNFKLAGIFTGDTDHGVWVADEVVNGMAAVLSMPVYTHEDEKGNGNEAKESSVQGD